MDIMNNIKLYINDNIVEVPSEYTVLQAINSSDEYIPQLCKDKDMKAIGACRTCLVKIDNVNGFPSSCSTPVSNNMKVYTNTDDLINIFLKHYNSYSLFCSGLVKNKSYINIEIIKCN